MTASPSRTVTCLTSAALGTHDLAVDGLQPPDVERRGVGRRATRRRYGARSTRRRLRHGRARLLARPLARPPTGRRRRREHRQQHFISSSCSLLDFGRGIRLRRGRGRIASPGRLGVHPCRTMYLRSITASCRASADRQAPRNAFPTIRARRTGSEPSVTMTAEPRRGRAAWPSRDHRVDGLMTSSTSNSRFGNSPPTHSFRMPMLASRHRATRRSTRASSCRVDPSKGDQSTPGIRFLRSGDDPFSRSSLLGNRVSVPSDPHASRLSERVAASFSTNVRGPASAPATRLLAAVAARRGCAEAARESGGGLA